MSRVVGMANEKEEFGEILTFLLSKKNKEYSLDKMKDPILLFNSDSRTKEQIIWLLNEIIDAKKIAEALMESTLEQHNYEIKIKVNGDSLAMESITTV